jgi:hypothetical protein
MSHERLSRALSYRLVNGDTGLAALLLIMGLYWAFAAVPLGLWQGFAPGTGFLPLCYGVLLAGLAGTILVEQVLHGEEQATRESSRKPLSVLLVVALTILGIEVAGFAPAIFVMLLVFFLWIERLSALLSLIVAAGTTLTLHLLFRTWLGVPLPEGPLGV